ncbi:MAG: FAD-binding oxidoreductase [Gemmatimonadaceae bacterium]|nr:FAD-binding oxidoreductase [Gemmatimonadaceae bacterium]
MSIELNIDREIREAYSSDASGVIMLPDAVARPDSPEEVVELLKQATLEQTGITPAGAQTSTTASSITDGGILLSLRRLARIVDFDKAQMMMRVEAGALLGDVKRLVAAEGMLFPPDPTSENESTVGGAIACNASGARSLRYGATRPHIRALKVALASGEIIELRRSNLEKNTVGYAFAHDPVDWFIGSEGTLGVILEAELGLIPDPGQALGIAFPFASEEMALGFVVEARESQSVSARCLEYFDGLAFEIARSADERPGWAPDAQAMVYVEEEGLEDADTFEKWMELAERFKADSDVRVFEGDSQLRQARRLRHAVPATMNERGAMYRRTGGRKVSTDWAVPYRRLGEALTVARQIAAGSGVGQAVIYGHAGNGHPHQNYVARDASELAVIERVIEKTLKAILAMGGTVAAEHGIGKLKRKWVGLQMSAIQIGAMRAIKHELDPYNVLARGNML